MATSPIIRQELEKLPQVKGTWFEWDLEHDGNKKTLVVEVSFDTDPNNSDFAFSALDDNGDALP